MTTSLSTAITIEAACNDEGMLDSPLVVFGRTVRHLGMYSKDNLRGWIVPLVRPKLTYEQFDPEAQHMLADLLRQAGGASNVKISVSDIKAWQPQ